MEFDRDYGYEYEALSEEEKAAFVGKVKNLREQEATNEDPHVRKLGHEADADVRSTIKMIVDGSLYLNDRTGYAVMSFGARSDYEATRQPFDMIPQALHGFIEDTFGITPTRFTHLMETYMLGGGATDSVLRKAGTKSLRSEVAERLRNSFGKFPTLLKSDLEFSDALFRNRCRCRCTNQLFRLVQENVPRQSYNA